MIPRYLSSITTRWRQYRQGHWWILNDSEIALCISGIVVVLSRYPRWYRYRHSNFRYCTTLIGGEKLKGCHLGCRDICSCELSCDVWWDCCMRLLRAVSCVVLCCYSGEQVMRLFHETVACSELCCAVTVVSRWLHPMQRHGPLLDSTKWWTGELCIVLSTDIITHRITDTDSTISACCSWFLYHGYCTGQQLHGSGTQGHNLRCQISSSLQLLFVYLLTVCPDMVWPHHCCTVLVNGGSILISRRMSGLSRNQS